MNIAVREKVVNSIGLKEEDSMSTSNNWVKGGRIKDDNKRNQGNREGF